MEGAAQSVDAFLRFAEALQEELEPGALRGGVCGSQK